MKRSAPRIAAAVQQFVFKSFPVSIALRKKSVQSLHLRSALLLRPMLHACPRSKVHGSNCKFTRLDASAFRYLAGTPQAVLGKRAAVTLLNGAAGDMFAAAGSASSTDAYVQACIKCLSLRADTSGHLQGQLDLVQVCWTSIVQMNSRR